MSTKPAAAASTASDNDRGAGAGSSSSRIVPRGYFGVGEERLVDGEDDGAGASMRAGDLKEGLDMGASAAPTPIEEETRWPAEVACRSGGRASAADFRRVAQQYSEMMLDFARTLMEVFGVAACAPCENFFVENSRTPVATLRILHYPGKREARGGAGGEESGDGGPDLACGAHSDYGLCTILADGGMRGLQVLPPRGDDWVDVLPVQGAFVVNTGAMMHRLTGGRFQNTIHRVVHAPGVANRISVPFFFNPSPSAVIEPFASPSQHDEQHPCGVETCASIISRRYVQSGLAVSSASSVPVSSQL